MSWKRHFSPVKTSQLPSSVSSPLGNISNLGPAKRNYSSYLPDVYTGSPNRIERILQYDSMDSDAEVNAALDILAEFCTQRNKENQTPFTIFFKGRPTNSEISILKEYLQQWVKMQQLNSKMFRIARNLFKYGDGFFIRDPETLKHHYIDPAKVVKIIVNESEGKKPEQYVIRDLNVNFMDLVVTQINPNSQNIQPGGAAYVQGGSGARGMTGGYPQQTGTRFSMAQNEFAIDAKHVVHLSMSEGLDNNYPFGTSLLETVFKVYKQKELLEDAIIIYRIQRAPERRIFYIDVGNMPPHLAMGFVERVKTEIHQRRIPSSTGGQSTIDSSYSPMSIGEDYYFPQCWTTDTKITLLDDRTLTLQDLIDEYEAGKTNYAYTVNQETLELEPGKIVWAGKTRLNAQLVEVTLDNGKTIKTTPDHRFIMRDGSEVEAQDLKENDSLMPLYLHDATTGKHQGADKYLKYTCPATGKKKWVHTMVCPKDVPGRLTEIHHIDCNSRNNSPDNLIEMETNEHRALHRSLGTYHMMNAWSDPVKRDKLVAGIRNYHANATEADKAMFRERGRINGSKTWVDESKREERLQQLSNARSGVADKKRIHYSDGMCERVIALYNQEYTTLDAFTNILRNDELFQDEYRKANANISRDKHLPNNIHPSHKTFNKIAQHLGYKNWNDFKKTYSMNHKVVSVMWLAEREDTGDITIESKSGSHNFAVAAGVFIHNSSEGRGSKVETLPGGQNIGEITDLQFFTNKLMRALRIPSSYLPTGPEDSQTQMNDGRVGTAYIQELRFNKYCERLQQAMVETFDSEFKLFLYNRGVNIDFSLFDLNFQSPQNFASYRQAELDNSRISTFTQMAALPFMSKRYAMKRFLGLTDEDLAENEKLWNEENKVDNKSDADAAGEMRSAGISPSGIASDMSASSGMEEGPPDLTGDLSGEETAPGGAVPTGEPPPV